MKRKLIHAGNALLLALANVVLWGSIGCGSGDRPELGTVSGKVTMDGQPLSGLIVVFKPDEGRAAVGETDSEGIYELEYLDGVAGCKVGPNTVSFEWPLGAGGKPIPQQYTAGRSTLKKDVQAGSNEINLEITSGGSGGGPAPKVE